MSENTRLDIDSNIPQEMDKIGKAADRAAKKISNVGSGSALEELQRMMRSVEREFKNFGGSANNAFDKALKNLSKSSMPDSVRDVYRNALTLAKEGRAALEAEYQKLGTASEDAAKAVIAAEAKLARAVKGRKNQGPAKAELSAALETQREVEGQFALARLNAENLKMFHLQLRDALNKEYNEFYLKRQATQKTANLQELQAFKDLGVKLIGEDAVLYKRLTESAKTAANLEKEQYQKKLESMASAQKEADTRFEAMRKDSLNRGKSLILQAAKDESSAQAAFSKAASEAAAKNQGFVNSYKRATEDLARGQASRAQTLLDGLQKVKAAAGGTAEMEAAAIKKYGKAFVEAAKGSAIADLERQLKATLARYTLDAATYKSIKAQVETTQAGGVYSNVKTRQLELPGTLPANMGKAGAALPGLSAGFKKLGDDMGYAHSFARGLASGFNLLWLTWGKLAPLFAGASISYGVAKTFQFGSEIEYNIRFLETLGDLTRTQGKAIREELRKMDESTMFSMSELSKTMITLGQAGYAAKDSLHLTKVSADLATVGMTDMDTSVKLLTQAMELFKKPTEDAEKVSSQLYMATKSGKLNIEDLGGSFKYASTAGIGYGQSLESVLTAMASLADIGIKSTQAGTSYVNMLQDLSGRSKPAIAAMDSLKKAAASVGKTITVFDDTGKMRDAAKIMFEIGEAIQLIKPSEQMKTLNALFTERGIRDYFAAVGKGEKQMTALQDAIAKVDPQKVFKDAKNMQDTVKAGFEIMKSTLTSSLDRVFEANSDKFREFFTGMTDLIGSKEFINSINLMVNSFSALYETLKVVGPALLVVGGAFLTAKTVAMVGAGISGLTTAFGRLLPFLTLTSYEMGYAAGKSFAATASFSAQGFALMNTGIQARMAAGGISAVSAASATAATTAATASTSMKVLAFTMGLLTNPIAGIISTLAILGVTWWATSRDSMAASQQLSDKVVENGKVNVKALNEEIAKLLEINAIRTQKSPIADMLPKAEADAKSAYATVTRLQATYDSMAEGLAKENLARQLVAERQKAKNSVETWQELAKGNKKYLDGIAAQERVAEIERQKKIREAQAKTPGTLDPNASDGGTPSNRSFDQYASSLTRQLAALKTKTAEEKQIAQARMTETEALYKREIDLIEVKNKAGMLSEGEYQVAVIQSTQQAEAAKLSLLEEANKKVSDANLSELAQQKKIQDKALADFKGTKEARKDLVDSYAEKIEAIQKQEVADTATYNAEIEKLKQESLFRIEKASIDHQGKLIKIQKDADKYLADLKGERAKEASLAAINRKYENVTDSSVIWLQAEKAAAVASAEAVGKHEAQLRESEKAYTDVAEAADKLGKASLDALLKGEDSSQLTVAWFQAEQQRIAQEKATAKIRKTINEDVANESAKAYEEAFRKRSSEFKNTLAQTLADALVSGANDGGQNLRKILENELKAPFVLLFRMSIDALMGDLSSAVGSATGGSGGSGGSGGVLSSLSAASTLSTAYKALSGAMEGSIGKSFEKFALSSFGEALGMSSKTAMYTSGSNLSSMGGGTGLTMGGSTGLQTTGTTGLQASAAEASNSLTSLGSTVKQVGVSMAAAFAGQALRKGISGGYSVGGAGETVMDIAALIAGFDPTGIASIVTGAVSGLINRTFGRKLKDTGIQGTFAGSEFKGENYQYLKGGFLRSDKTKTSAMDSEAVNTFTNTFRSIQASTAVLATNMGLSAKSALDFKKDIKLSLKDLDPAAQSEAITKMFTEVQEEMATAVLDAWGDWSLIAKYGETASEVLTNVSNNLTGFNGMLDLLDLKLIDLTMNGAAAASAVIEAAGGVDALTGIYSSYYENFYSEAERNSKSIETLGEKFAALGVTFPTLTKDAEGFVTNGDEAREVFRGLVSAAANAGNITLATELVKLSDAFAEVTPLAEKFIESLKDQSKSLNAEFLKAQGNIAGYKAAIRAIETVDMTALEVATYDYNKTLEDYIELLGQADEARATASEAEIRLLEAQGNKTAALVKQRELDVKGLSEAQVAAYDYAAAIDSQIEAMEKFKAAQDSITASDIKLLQAQGNATLALAKQRELDIRSMTQAEVAAYDYSNAIDAQIGKLQKAADIVSKLGSVSSDLGAYLQQFEAESSNMFYATIQQALSGDLDAMGRVTSEADRAIEDARRLSRSTSEFNLKQANVLAKVGQVKAFADKMAKETDTDRLIAAIKGSTVTSDEVKGLGTRLSSQDLAVSLNATLEGIQTSAGAEVDIWDVKNLFSSMLAYVTDVGFSYVGSVKSSNILHMFDNMRATVQQVSLTAPVSQTNAIANLFNNLVGRVTAINTATGVLPQAVSAITTSLSNFQVTVSKVAVSAASSNLKTFLLSNASDIAYGLSIKAAMDNSYGSFGLSAQKASELLNNLEIVKTLSVKAGTDGTLTTAQQQAYANASTSISKAISVIRGTDASNLTDAQKVLLGILGGASNGQVSVGGSVDYEPSSDLDYLMSNLTTALGKVGIDKMTTELGRLVAALDQQRANDAAAKSLADAQRAGADIAAKKSVLQSAISQGIDKVTALASSLGLSVNRAYSEVAQDFITGVTSQSISFGNAVKYTKGPLTADVIIPIIKAFNAAGLGNSNAIQANSYNMSLYDQQLAAARQAVIALGGVPQFARGGYTGPGGVNEPAGVVHKGEVVWSQSDIAKAGGLSIVEAMRNGDMSYAEGIPAPASNVSYTTQQSTIELDESALLAELQALREEVSNMRYEVRATAVNTGKAAKHLKEFDDRGMKVKNSDSGALEVTVV